MEHTISVVALVAALGSMALYFTGGIRFGKLELKVDTMWAFQMRRALAESVNSGVATMNSPLKFTSEIRAYLDPIRLSLREFHQAVGFKMNDTEELLEIERRFGDNLARDVCIPCRISQGSCLLLALAVARDTEDLVIKIPQVAA